MEFPISDVIIDPWKLMLLGFAVGVLGGFFGVGGSFLAGPSMFALGIPMNVVVGTDLAHIAGKSMVAARKHRALGNVDFRLAGLMVAGTVAGVEVGAQLIEWLKARGNVDHVVAICSLAVFGTVALWVGWEAVGTLRGCRPNARTAFCGWAQGWRFGPRINLPASGIQAMPVVPILLVGFVGGLFSGFLGGGAGYLRMPMMVYLLGVPTHVAVGTDLFEIVISAGYGTVSHALKGNVDILIALVMHTGAAMGAHIGAGLTPLFSGARLRLMFVPLPLIGAGILIYKLLTGGGGH